MAEPATAVKLLATDGNAGTQHADVAKSLPDGDTKNTFVRYRKVRIQVLDCRSGEPLQGVPVQGAWLADADGGNAVAVAKYKWMERDWDIAANLPIWLEGGERYLGANQVSFGFAVQTALKGLGFDCGTPVSKFSDRALTSVLKFMISRRQIALTPEAVAALGLATVDTIDPSHITKNKAGKRILKGVTDSSGKEVLFEPPTDDQAKKYIFREYNTRCFRAAQFHLATNGFVPAGQDPLSDGQVDDSDPLLDNRDEGRWTTGWIGAYQRWQGTVLGRTKNQHRWIKTAADGARLMNGARRFVTDERGFLNIPVPVARIKAGLRIEVAFKDFCVVAESTKKEWTTAGTDQVFRSPISPSPAAIDSDNERLKVHEPARGETRFRVFWTGPMNLDSGGANPQEGDPLDGTVQSVAWGWKLERRGGSAQPARSSREFRTSWAFTIPAFDYGPQEKIDWWALQQSSHAPLSMFYDGSDVTPEFVLFALQWCQPVFDEFDDAPARTDLPVIDEDTYVWTNGERGMRMHVVTQFYDMGGWDIYGGKGYGLYEAAPWTRWRGVDNPINVIGGLHRLRLLGYKVGRDPDTGDMPSVAETEKIYNEELKAKQDSGGSEQGVRCMMIISDYQADAGIPTSGELDALTLKNLDDAVRAKAKADPTSSEFSPPRRREWGDPDDGHAGVDLHAGVGAPLFAGHGGSFKWIPSTTNKIGNLAQVTWRDPKARSTIGYGHCKAKVGDNRYVRAGEIVAKAGRTGNLAAVSDQAGHVHLNCGDPDDKGIRVSPDPANRVCFPKNAVTPLLLPCRCELTQPPAAGEIALSDCKFDNAKAAGKSWLRTASCCWAVAELACPHMPRGFNADKLKEAGAVKERRCVQAQLRKLGLYTPDPTSSPQDPQVKAGAQTTALDGDFGLFTESLKVKADNTKVRTQTSQSSTSVATLAKGTVLTPLGTSSEWYRVKPADTEGFIQKAHVTLVGVSDTRRAILAFKEQESLVPAGATAEQKYEMDQKSLDRLNVLAPLAPKAKADPD